MDKPGSLTRMNGQRAMERNEGRMWWQTINCRKVKVSKQIERYL